MGNQFLRIKSIPIFSPGPNRKNKSTTAIPIIFKVKRPQSIKIKVEIKALEPS